MTAKSITATETGKPVRSLCILSPFGPDGRGVVRITETKGRKVEVKVYTCTAFRADFGLGLTFDNADEGTCYHVNIDGPERSSCECKGQLRWGHLHPCRHIAAGLKLLADGKLTVPGVQPEEQPCQCDWCDSLTALEAAGC